MKIGILTAGGDCPGINAAIRGVAKAAILGHSMEIVGINDGFLGLINKDYVSLNEYNLSGILTLGGTILGTSREKPYKKKKDEKESSKVDIILKNYKEAKFDAIVCIGGNGTMKTASILAKEGMNVVGIPKTIDNDVWGTDITFGFDSAVNIATEAIDRLHTTANSHKRIMVIEVMGHKVGWISLFSGIAGGGDIVLIPEIKFNEDIICNYLEHRSLIQKKYSIIVVAEGIETKDNMKAGEYIAKVIQEKIDYDTRVTVLGYIQRGGTPSPADRILATRYGTHAVDLIVEQNYGRMVASHGNNITSIPLSEVEGKTRTIDPLFPLIKKARKIGTCFGDKMP